jgi:hypothetical protein
MLFFLLWWCFDDHLAQALGMPGVGTMPWWVILLIGILFTAVVEREVVVRVRD